MYGCCSQAIVLTLPAISQCRLRALRQACFSSLDNSGSSGSGSGKDVSPLLLFVAGQDGRNNAGSAAALQYLLLGQSGRLLTTAASAGTALSSSSLPDQLEDCVVVIAPDHARVYFSGDAVDAMSRLVSCWGHTVEWVLASKEMEDMERAERFKVPVPHAASRRSLRHFPTRLRLLVTRVAAPQRSV
jgi:hypothetical protein